jgi:hypothetical protein
MLYQHQGTKEIYFVHYLTENMESGNRFVVYSITTDPENKTWTVPIELFFSQIEVDGVLVDRFLTIHTEEAKLE